MRLIRPLTVLALLLAALGLLPAAAQAAVPTIRVSVTRGLHGGDVVRVVGRGLTPHASVDVTQCDSLSGDPEYDCAPTTTVTAGTYGALSVRITLGDPVFRAEPFGSATPVYCRADTCRIYLSWTDADGSPQVVASPRLLFRGAPATIAADPATDLVDGQSVRVTGTAVGAAGQRVQVVEQGCFDIIQATGCYGALEVRTTRVQPGGGWALTYPVHQVLTDGASDCADPDILGSCVLSATVLDGQGNPDDSYGLSSAGRPSAGLTFATP